MLRLPSRFWRYVGFAALLAVVVLAAVSGWRWYHERARLVMVEVVQRSVHIAEPVEVEAEVSLPWGRRLTGRVELAGAGEGLSIEGTPTTALKCVGLGTWRQRIRFTLVAVELGEPAEVSAELLLAPLVEGRADRLAVPLGSLKVIPRLAPADEGDPEAATSPALPEAKSAAVERRPFPWLPVAGAAAALLTLALVLLLWRRRRAERPGPPPWIVADDELAALAQRLPLPPEPFYVALSDILRRYLEALFRFPAAEQTTPEILACLGGLERPDEDGQRERLAALLTGADQVKFARREPDEADLRSVLAAAGGLVAELAERVRREQAEAALAAEEADA